jgi:beta-lactamase superfamily II metal-dependent hydrolase
MSAGIHIRAYVVGFGDCILLRLPDGRRTRHMLIDFGRAPNDAVSLGRFPAIARDIRDTTEGHLDVLVMTHEHLDHLEGFYHERSVFDTMQIDQVWMGLPSHPDYYKRYRNARQQKKLQERVRRFAQTARRRGMALHPAFQALLANNLANMDRINYIRKLAKKPVAYMARGKGDDVAKRWSKNIKVHVLSPEEDTSVYYGGTGRDRARGAALAATDGVSPVTSSDEGFGWDFRSVPRAAPGDQPGLSTSEFERLRRTIREDGVAAARFIDHAQNNTSLCLLIEVAGKRLLLPGDAELESWAMMQRYCRSHLKPVDFLKVAHHGSHNGTPIDLLETLLPTRRAKHAHVLVSTKRNIYGTKNPVPDAGLLKKLRRHAAEVVSTDGRPGTHVDIVI